MQTSLSLLFRKKQTRPFNDFYREWFNTLQHKLLPLIHQSLTASSRTLSSRVDLLLQHFLSYYDSLDLAATVDTIPHLLFPSWRNPLEIPFLFIGDLHPYLFTTLLRSFLDRDNNNNNSEEEEDNTDNDGGGGGGGGFRQMVESRNLFFRPIPNVPSWKNPSKGLMTRVEQIECGLRLMVPALVSRMKKVQAKFLARVAEEWVSCQGKKMEIDKAMKEEMEELVSVFSDANRLRRSVFIEIVSATSVEQAALFLEGLAQFLVGFKDPVVVGQCDTYEMPFNYAL